MVTRISFINNLFLLSSKYGNHYTQDYVLEAIRMKIFAYAISMILLMSMAFGTVYNSIESSSETEYWDGEYWKPSVELTDEQEHPAYDSYVTIPAAWIWRTYPIAPEDAVEGDTVEFKRTFTLPDCASRITGMLYITADNAYEVKLNGNLIGDDDNWYSTETYDLTGNLTVGVNEFRFIVTNWGISGTTPENNPAAFIYDVVYSYEGCSGGNGGDGEEEDPSVPEFGTLAAFAAVLGGLGITFFMRRN
jgi:hypothetical protein